MPPGWTAGNSMIDPTHRLSDTSPDAEAVLLEIYRRMPAWKKIRIVEDENRTSRRLAMMGLRSRHPDESDRMLKRRLLGLLLGEADATTVYGPIEDLR